LKVIDLGVHSKGSTNMSSPTQVIEHRLQHRSAVATSDAVLRALGVVMLMGLALDHIVQLVPTFQTQWPLGIGYLFLIAGIIIVGARLMMGAPSRVHLWAPVAILGLAAMFAYAFTRVVSTPLDSQDVGNWACSLGMVALFLEVVLVAISAYAIANRRHARETLVAVRG
jgi:hypothetical protein